MADLHNVKAKRVDDIAEDDPLAELTRIMGVAPKSAPTEAEFDDFGIDLERELLGEFEPIAPANAPGTAPRQEAPAVRPAPAQPAEVVRQLHPQPVGPSEAPRDYRTGMPNQGAGLFFSRDTGFRGTVSPVVQAVRESRPAPVAPAAPLAAVPPVAAAQPAEADVSLDDALDAFLSDLSPAPAAQVAPHIEDERAEAVFADEDFALPEDEFVAPAQDEPDFAPGDEELALSLDEAELAAPEPVAVSSAPVIETYEERPFDPFAELSAMARSSHGRADLHAGGQLYAAEEPSLRETVAAAPAVHYSAPARAEADAMALDLDDALARELEAVEFDAPVDDAADASAYGALQAGLEVPDIDTVDVPERAVAISDEIDVPDLVFEDDLPRAGEADDLDLEFANAFESLSDSPNQWQAASARPASSATIYSYADARAATAPAPAQQAAYAEAEDERWRLAVAEDEFARTDQTRYDEQDWPEGYRGEAQAEDDLPSAFHGGYADQPREARGGSRRRGFAVAALLAGVAVIGGAGAFALWSGGDSSSPPTLVRADSEPVKVKPETPGGVTVPNQDKAVYDNVPGAQAAAPPKQEKLVSVSEEPVEIPAPVRNVEAGAATDVAAAAKSEDRVEPALDTDATATTEVPAVAPRKVRTMVVKPDGTLVPREEPIEVAAAAPTAEAPLAMPLTPATTGATEPVAAATPAAPAAEPAPEATAAVPAEAPRQAMPARVPVAPSRPADQPVEIVGNAAAARPTQVAAALAAPEPTTQAAGGWSMQIASQPSADGAQASYVDLARRYGSVLNGRAVNIVKADIAGKGTFWRVRISAETRAEAIALCERYKAAGGSCFVGRS